MAKWTGFSRLVLFPFDCWKTRLLWSSFAIFLLALAFQIVGLSGLSTIIEEDIIICILLSVLMGLHFLLEFLSPNSINSISEVTDVHFPYLYTCGSSSSLVTCHLFIPQPFSRSLGAEVIVCVQLGLCLSELAGLKFFTSVDVYICLLHVQSFWIVRGSHLWTLLIWSL